MQASIQYQLQKPRKIGNHIDLLQGYYLSLENTISVSKLFWIHGATAGNSAHFEHCNCDVVILECTCNELTQPIVYPHMSHNGGSSSTVDVVYPDCSWSCLKISAPMTRIHSPSKTYFYASVQRKCLCCWTQLNWPDLHFAPSPTLLLLFHPGLQQRRLHLPDCTNKRKVAQSWNHKKKIISNLSIAPGREADITRKAVIQNGF